MSDIGQIQEFVAAQASRIVPEHDWNKARYPLYGGAVGGNHSRSGLKRKKA